MFPFSIRMRGRRNGIETPDGASAARQTVDNTSVRALARAFRWKRMLESGQFYQHRKTCGEGRAGGVVFGPGVAVGTIGAVDRLGDPCRQAAVKALIG